VCGLTVTRTVTRLPSILQGRVIKANEEAQRNKPITMIETLKEVGWQIRAATD
jgi:hypothetical protein